MNGRLVQDSQVTLTQVMGVTDANTLGNVHGGLIMKLCDEAGGWLGCVMPGGRW
ncbi:MAG: hypothetical protein R3C44_09475 [Chloroflexota bacterium]